ncbi:UNVERIFIED_CONTAM: hypothetical protein K2H54_005517 [Gekko kuhli]
MLSLSLHLSKDDLPGRNTAASSTFTFSPSLAELRAASRAARRAANEVCIRSDLLCGHLCSSAHGLGSLDEVRPRQFNATVFQPGGQGRPMWLQSDHEEDRQLQVSNPFLLFVP